LLDVTHRSIFPSKLENTFIGSKMPEFCVNALGQETSFFKPAIDVAYSGLSKDISGGYWLSGRAQNQEITAQRL